MSGVMLDSKMFSVLLNKPLPSAVQEQYKTQEDTGLQSKCSCDSVM